MTVTILDKQWKIKVLKTKPFVKLFGDDCVGMCDPNNKTIYYWYDGLTIPTIIHELVHAYTDELSFKELDLKDEQIEEFFCELVSKHQGAMMENARKIIGALNSKKFSCQRTRKQRSPSPCKKAR